MHGGGAADEATSGTLIDVIRGGSAHRRRAGTPASPDSLLGSLAARDRARRRICSKAEPMWAEQNNGNTVLTPGEYSREKVMTDDPRKRGEPDRSKISMSEEHEVRYWTKHLGVTQEELQKAVDKVGDS